MKVRGALLVMMGLAAGFMYACNSDSPAVSAAAPTPGPKADYRRDRAYNRGMSASEFSRLYPGRMSTQRCLGYTLEQCQTLPAVVEKYECRTRGDGMMVCDGKRQLFLGTESDHQPIGPEQREFRLRDGKIEAEWAVVQMVEELVFGAQPETATRRCERFGEVGLSDCQGVVALGALPPLARGAASFSRAYTPEELSGIAGTVQMIQSCIQGVPEIRQDAEAAYARWRASRADAVAFMETRLLPTITAAVAANQAGPVDFQAKTTCGAIIVSLDMQSRAPNPKFTTAESTWSAFKAALAGGDAKAAADCFANPYDQFGGMISQLSVSDLSKLNASLTGFDMIDGPEQEEWRRGLVTRSDGISGEVVFVKMGAEWHISQM
jgi:hypothetical protein